MIYLLTTLIISNVHPSLSNCQNCVEFVDEMKHNQGLNDTLNQIENLCRQLDFPECVNITNQTHSYLNNINSTELCDELGFCDTIDFDNYICRMSNKSLNISKFDLNPDLILNF